MENLNIVNELMQHKKLLQQMAADILEIKKIALRTAPSLTPDQEKAEIEALVRRTNQGKSK